MILAGKEYVQKWEEYFDECEKKKKINEQLKKKICERELFEKLKKQLHTNCDKGFVDTYINL
jgi:hypothetical protein